MTCGVVLFSACTERRGEEKRLTHILQASSNVPFNGPIDNNYRLTTSVPTEALVWATCGVTGPLFNVNSQAIINCKQDAILGVDTQDTKFVMELHLQWKQC